MGPPNKENEKYAQKSPLNGCRGIAILGTLHFNLFPPGILEILYRDSKPKEIILIIVRKVQEYGNQYISKKAHNLKNL
jgi:hypothetical protein